MGRPISIRPERVAYFEASGWRAYYDRKWFKMLFLLVRAYQEQFRIPLLVSLVASYYTIRASMAWIPLHHDEGKVLAYLEKFYALARRYSGLTYDVKHVAALELQYFAVHRRLSGKPDKGDFLQTLIDLHAALFHLTVEQARPSAQWRLQAAVLVDRITAGDSTDVEGDWHRVEANLREAYRAVAQELL